uniref:Uncharacterized protein n=1 Tax=Arundo donax TaxID=35708 RepID=A0A0A9EZA2_ARUDO
MSIEKDKCPSIHVELRLASSFIMPLKLLANQIAVSRGGTLAFPNGFRTIASSSSLLCSSSSAESSKSPSRASARCLKDVTSSISFAGDTSSLNPLLIARVLKCTSSMVGNFIASVLACF